MIPTLRSNRDNIVNTYGKQLLQLCKATGMVIVNGRFYKDKDVGNVTYTVDRGKVQLTIYWYHLFP